MIVDDDPVTLALLSFVLQKRGLKVEAVGDGRDALGLLSSQEYDVLFTDLRLPEMSGLTLAAEALKRFPEMLTVLMTATANEELADMLPQVKFDHRLTKPFSLTDVENVLDHIALKKLRAHS